MGLYGLLQGYLYLTFLHILKPENTLRYSGFIKRVEYTGRPLKLTAIVTQSNGIPLLAMNENLYIISFDSSNTELQFRSFGARERER
jgi:hypothetical protein